MHRRTAPPPSPPATAASPPQRRRRRRRRLPGEAPYATPDGGVTRYHADRFYLDTPTDLSEWRRRRRDDLVVVGPAVDDDDDDGGGYCDACGERRGGGGRTRTTTTTTTTTTTIDVDDDAMAREIGGRRTMFDRTQFVNSLDLIAVVIGTYVVGDADYLTREFPTMFPPPTAAATRGEEERRGRRRHVPTLVLHGRRTNFDVGGGSSSRILSRSRSPRRPPSSSPSSSKSSHPPRGIADRPEAGNDPDDEDDVGPASIRGGNDRASEEEEDQKERRGRGGTTATTTTTTTTTTGGGGGRRVRLTFDGRALDLPRTPKRPRADCRIRRASSSSSSSSSSSRAYDGTGPGKDGATALGSPPESSPSSPLARRMAPPVSMDTPPDSPPSTPPTTTTSTNTSTSSAPSRDAASGGPDRAVDEDDDEVVVVVPGMRRSSPPRVATAGDILSRVLGRPMPRTTIRPILYDDVDADSSQDNDALISGAWPSERDAGGTPAKAASSLVDDDNGDNCDPATGRGRARPSPSFGGEAFFTLVRPRRRPAEGRRRSLAEEEEEDDDDDDDDDNREPGTTVRGVHHPKFFLLFERSGSLVVVVSTSNLTPQTAMEGSWVQRFESREIVPRPTYVNDIGGGGIGGRGGTDHGMPSDFGVVLTDFLEKQSEAAAPDGGMLPDAFLRRYVPGLSSGLAALADRYRFDEAEAHLVSTVPGAYVSGIPTSPGNGHHQYSACGRRVAYGPQRVSFVLSRILNDHHIRSARAIGAVGSQRDADKPWLPPSLVSAKDRLVMQPTSLGGNWSRDDLEAIVRSYMLPHWKLPQRGSVNDRLYVSDPNHIAGCQCGQGKRWYKDRLKTGDGPSFLDCVKKVLLR
ncbi:hypothetical protein ACHAW5_004840 [Stephanodiscus triporus]|uniref:Tyrosyl-DNA phosphodiesterase 1 n=1 Tax=Stephanodiscus triporus TaxID=2934178 RepID=A0ABD3MLF2_9STRA